MDYSQFLALKQEIGLLIVFLLVFLYDTFCSPRSAKAVPMIATVLMGLLVAWGFCPVVKAPETAFAGMYVTSPVMVAIKNILNVGALIVLIQSIKWANSEFTSVRRGEFYELILLTLFGMYLMISSRHFLMFIIGLETASLPLCALVAFDKHRYESHEAAIKYVLTAVFSSAILLMGLSLVYGLAGTLYYNGIAAALSGQMGVMLAVALAFVMAGFGFKLSLVPFHLWTADVYEGAPSVVTAYLSVISKGSAAFVLLTILIKTFAPMIDQWQEVLYWVIIASITLANLFALRQENLKRLMAFSSISQAGYIMLGVIAGTQQGMASLVYYVLIYMFANLSVFAVITIIALRAHRFTLEEYNGLYSTNPKLAFLMTLALFSLAGIPPFAGFFSKFFIFAAAFQGGFHLLVFIALVNTIISLYYYLKIVKSMYINKSDEPIATFRSDNYTRASLIICTLGIIVLSLASVVYQSIDKFSFGLN